MHRNAGARLDKQGEKGLTRPIPGTSGDLSALITELAPIQEATDIRDLFAGLARSIVAAVKADACAVSLLDEEKRLVRDVAACVRPPYRMNAIVEEYQLSKYPVTRQVVSTGVAVEISVFDPDADPNERAFLEDLGYSRVLLSALLLEGAPIGLVETFRRADRPFRVEDPQQIDVLSTFAANAYSRIQLAATLESHYTTTIEALVSALEARDPYTNAHTSRIRDLAGALADAMQVPSEVRRAVRLGAILHDVGKIGISDEILRKPGPLSEEEWEVMRTHPQIGRRMLEGIDFLAPSMPVILHHHERWDGKGYPAGLEGEEIPLGARIVAVCDAFDAMTSDRPYRKAMSIEQALDEISAKSGTQFDPVCAAVICDVIDRLGNEHLEERFVRYAI